MTSAKFNITEAQPLTEFAVAAEAGGQLAEFFAEYVPTQNCESQSCYDAAGWTSRTGAFAMADPALANTQTFHEATVSVSGYHSSAGGVLNVEVVADMALVPAQSPASTPTPVASSALIPATTPTPGTTPSPSPAESLAVHLTSVVDALKVQSDIVGSGTTGPQIYYALAEIERLTGNELAWLSAIEPDDSSATRTFSDYRQLIGDLNGHVNTIIEDWVGTPADGDYKGPATRPAAEEMGELIGLRSKLARLPGGYHALPGE